MKILNLYACLGGNRYKWDEVTDIEVTAVELDPELARMYQERFPNDTVIVADAHQYLLDHYKEFDFIWSSPPCPSHSMTNTFLNPQGLIRYPDMKLYEEIIFLKHFYKGKYVVENVNPYYEPLIAATKRGRHLYWTNFNLPNILSDRSTVISACKPSTRKIHRENSDIKRLSKFHQIDLSSYKGKQRKDKIARNLVDYEAGKTILQTVVGIVTKQNAKQIKLFDA